MSRRFSFFVAVVALSASAPAFAQAPSSGEPSAQPATSAEPSRPSARNSTKMSQPNFSKQASTSPIDPRTRDRNDVNNTAMSITMPGGR